MCFGEYKPKRSDCRFYWFTLKRDEPNFCLLERDETALVYGLIGRFWQAEYGLEDVADGPGFLAFAQPGVAKLALGCRDPLPSGHCRLVTETRIFCPDDASRRRFTPTGILFAWSAG